MMVRNIYSLALILFIASSSNAQVEPALNDTTSIEPNSIRLAVIVIGSDDTYVKMKVERVILAGRSITTSLAQGDELSAMHSDRRKPKIKSKMLVDLLERIDIEGNATYVITKCQPIK